MRARYKFGLWVLWLVLTGCAGANHPPQPPTKTGSLEPLRVDATQADLSQVAAPKDLVLVARAERLDNAAATLARWMNLPFDLRVLDTLGPGLSQTIIADAPIEAAVALAEASDTEVPQPHAVFSAGIASIDAGRKLFEKFGRRLEETSPGVWLTGDESPVACGLAQALGRAQVRIVCGDRRVDVETLLPYATRGLPLQAMGTSDLHIEVKLAPMRERYQQRLRQVKALAIPMALHELGFMDARISRPITDILYALGDEIIDVVDDMDNLAIDARIASDPERVDVTAALAFARAHSWSAQTLADARKRAASAPTLFFELPTDASMASFSSPHNPKSLDKLVHWLGSLLDGALSHIAVNAKVRDNLVRSTEQLNDAPSGPGVCAAAPAASNTSVTRDQDIVTKSMNAWQICATDQLPAAKLTAVLDAWVSVAADTAFRKFMGDKAIIFRRAVTPVGLPTGSAAYEAKLDVETIGRSLQKLLSDSEAPLNNCQEDCHRGQAVSAFNFHTRSARPKSRLVGFWYGCKACRVAFDLGEERRPRPHRCRARVSGAFPQCKCYCWRLSHGSAIRRALSQ